MKHLVREFLEWKGSHTERAAYAYRYPLEQFCDFIRKKPEDLVIGDIASYTAHLKTKYAPATVAFRVATLKSFLIYLQAKGLKSLHPTFVKIPKFASPRRIAVTDEDMVKFCATENEWEFWGLQKILCYRLMWETGLRVSELCDLNIADLDRDKASCQILTKKARQYRWLMWSATTHELLLRFLGTRLSLNQNPWLLMTGAGRKRLTPRTVERWVEEGRGKAKIWKHLTPHSFRHGCAHRLISLGANVKEIALILGHSEENPSASFKYLKLNEREALGIAKKYLLV